MNLARHSRLALAGCLAALALLAPTATSASATPLNSPPTAMPNLVGDNLATAYGQLPFERHLKLIDGTGKHRLVVLPSNWKVCAQNPQPGTQIDSATSMALTVVRNLEQCPAK